MGPLNYMFLFITLDIFFSCDIINRVISTVYIICDIIKMVIDNTEETFQSETLCLNVVKMTRKHNVSCHGNKSSLLYVN